MMIWHRGYHLKISRFLEKTTQTKSESLSADTSNSSSCILCWGLLVLSLVVFLPIWYVCLPAPISFQTAEYPGPPYCLCKNCDSFGQQKKQWSCRNAIQPMPLTLTNYRTLEGCHNMEGLVHLAYTDRFWLEQFWHVSQVIVYHWFILTSDVILGRTSRLPWGIAGNAADAKRGCSGRTPREGEMGNWPSFPMSTVVDH